MALSERLRLQIIKRFHPMLPLARRPWHGPFVLLYHHLADVEGPYLDHQSVTGRPRDFEAQIAFLAAHYRLVRFSELHEFRYDPRAVAITFDDGFRSVASTALPIAERYGCPIKLFLTVCNVAQELNWMCKLSLLFHELEPRELVELADRALLPGRDGSPVSLSDFLRRFDHAKTPAAVNELFSARGALPAERLYLDDTETRTLAAHPLVELGSHSRNHYPLPALPDPAVHDEVVAAHQELLSGFGPAVRDHAVPFGRPEDLTPAVADAHREIGSPLISNYGGRYQETARHGVPEIRRRSMRGNVGVLYHRLTLAQPV